MHVAMERARRLGREQWIKQATRRWGMGTRRGKITERGGRAHTTSGEGAMAERGEGAHGRRGAEAKGKSKKRAKRSSNKSDVAGE